MITDQERDYVYQALEDLEALIWRMSDSNRIIFRNRNHSFNRIPNTFTETAVEVGSFKTELSKDCTNAVFEHIFDRIVHAGKVCHTDLGFIHETYETIKEDLQREAQREGLKNVQVKNTRIEIDYDEIGAWLDEHPDLLDWEDEWRKEVMRRAANNLMQESWWERND